MGFWGKLFTTGLVAYPLLSAEQEAKKRNRKAFEDGLRAREDQTRDKPLAPKWFWEQEAPSVPPAEGKKGPEE